jgi:hypothetical protein
VTHGTTHEEIQSKLSSEIPYILNELECLGYTKSDIHEVLDSRNREVMLSQSIQLERSSSQAERTIFHKKNMPTVDQVERKLSQVGFDHQDIDMYEEVSDDSIHHKRQKARIDRSSANVQALINKDPISTSKTVPGHSPAKYARSQDDSTADVATRLGREEMVTSSGRSGYQGDRRTGRSRMISSSQPVSGSANPSPSKPLRSSVLNEEKNMKALVAPAFSGSSPAKPLALGSPIAISSTKASRKDPSKGSSAQSSDTAVALDDPKPSKRGKRSIRSQEQDEQFQIESQGGIMSRRNKVVTATIAEQSEGSSDEEARRNTTTYLRPTKKRPYGAVQKLRQSISGQQELSIASKTPPNSSKRRETRINANSGSESGDKVSSRSARDINEGIYSEVDEDHAPSLADESAASSVEEEVHQSRPKRRAADKASAMTKHILDPLIIAQQRNLDLASRNPTRRAAENKRKRPEEDSQPVSKRQRLSEAEPDDEDELLNKLRHEGPYKLMTSRFSLSDSDKKVCLRHYKL